MPSWAAVSIISAPSLRVSSPGRMSGPAALRGPLAPRIASIVLPAPTAPAINIGPRVDPRAVLNIRAPAPLAASGFSINVKKPPVPPIAADRPRAVLSGTPRVAKYSAASGMI